MRIKRYLPFLFAFCLWLPAARGGAGDFPIDQELDAVKSPYTDTLIRMIKSWPPSGASHSIPETEGPLRLRCWETPGNDLYMGAEQFMIVNAPLAAVEAVLDDVNHYADLFVDLEQVKLVSTEKNRWLTFWEQNIPLFFVPNVKYEMLYLVDKARDGRKVYRYQLRKPTKLRHSDGMIVIEKRGDSQTAYTEFDFFDAEWGPAKILGKEKLWRDAIEGLFLSDIAVKLKAENPGWTHPRAREESKKTLERFPVDSCVQGRKPFSDR